MPNIVDNGGLYGGPSIYDTIILNGVSSPGVVTLSGHDRKVVWDVQGGPFLNGATVRYKWTPPIEFTASFYLVKDLAQGTDDFALWPAFATLINSTVANPRDPRALAIYHPDLAANGIKSVVKGTIGGFVYDRKGGATVVVKFQEYRPFRLQEGTPTAKPADDPNAQMESALQGVTTQCQNTPWG